MSSTRTAPVKDSRSLKEFEKPFEIALFFGFSPIKTPSIEKEDLSILKTLRDPYYEEKRIQTDAPFIFDPLEKISVLRSLAGENADAFQPSLLAYKKPIAGTFGKKSGDFVMGLEAIGFPGSSAEALILRTTLSILEEEGHKNLFVLINSLGDKDSVSEFERMVAGFVRKHMNGFPADIRKMAKKDIFDILRSTDEKHTSVQEQAPKSISFLTESSRVHMKEVLEYLEAFGVPYRITPRLIGSPSFCSHTIFEIRDEDGEGSVLAQGYRYSRLSKRLGFKKEMPALGVTIAFKKKSAGKLYKAIPKPRFYLIQLSFSAKLATLAVIEILRKARISVAYSISKDKLGSQLGTAENMRVPYVLIIGQKEALEKTVVIRDVNTRVQETIPIERIADYVKKLK